MVQPQMKRKKGVSVVWLLPVIAFAICGWLLSQSLQNRGVEIEVSFSDASGIVKGKTQVMYKGIPIGLVKDLSVQSEMKRVKVSIEMVRESEKQLVEDLLFWVVRPHVSASKIVGLDTLIGGSYISVRPGQSKKRVSSFVGLEEVPSLPPDTPGLHLKLKTDKATSLGIGVPVFHKFIEVGVVTSVDFTEGAGVEIGLLIHEKYAQYVSDKSVFWNMSGVSFSGNISSIKVSIGTLATMLSGGIGFETFPGGGAVEQGSEFVLFDDHKIAKRSQGEKIELLLSDLEHVKAGTEIHYKGTVLGEVNQIEMGENFTSVKATAFVDENMMGLFTEKTLIWLVKPEIGLSGIKNVQGLVRGAYLEILPGVGEAHDQFVVLESQPAKENYPGHVYILGASRPGSIKAGNKVYFRQLPVGEVIKVELSPLSDGVDIYVGIKKKFEPLVRENTKFWNGSGIRVSGGLMTEMRVSTQSLEAMLVGGIAFATPGGTKTSKLGERVSDGHRFSLAQDPEDEWFKWAPEILLDGTVVIKAEETEEKANKE